MSTRTSGAMGLACAGGSTARAGCLRIAVLAMSKSADSTSKSYFRLRRTVCDSESTFLHSYGFAIMALDTWLIYLAAATGLALMPGPNGLLALTHGALYGRRMTLFTISGGVLGFVLVLALSMFGIGAVLGASVHALTVMKWLGGAYLV